MVKMKKVVILMPVHCAPKVAMMTLGTWLETCDGSYRAEVIICAHDNYSHYHPGLDTLKELPVTVISVPEINWYFPDLIQSIMRYSRMHAVSLTALMEKAQNIQFDHLAILDHDLVFKTDFVKAAADTGSDLVGGYMCDRKDSAAAKTAAGIFQFAPKFSIWHLVMSQLFYQKVMEDRGLIFPAIEGGNIFDTFTKVIAKNRDEWHLPVTEWSCAEMDAIVQHRWSMSFNFGQKVCGVPSYWDRVSKYEAEFDQRFPNGIKHLFERVGL